MKQELAEKSKTLFELTKANMQLSQQCESLYTQLETALEINENQKKEKKAWEMSLKQASEIQKKKDKRKQQEKLELEKEMEAKENRISDL